jgi:hypothetical protein
VKKKKRVNVEQMEAAMHQATGKVVKDFEIDSCLQIMFFEGKAKIAVFVNGDESTEKMYDVMIDSLQAIMEGMGSDFTTYTDENESLN